MTQHFNIQIEIIYDCFSKGITNMVKREWTPHTLKVN